MGEGMASARDDGGVKAESQAGEGGGSQWQLLVLPFGRKGPKKLIYYEINVIG